MSKVKKDSVSLEERNHVFISEVGLQMHQSQIPLWSKAQIYFQSLTIDDISMDSESSLNGEFEIEKIPTHMVEARSKYLVPAINYLQGPKVQITRVPVLDYNCSGTTHEKLSNRSSFDPIYSTVNTVVTNGGLENGDEETGEDASQMPVEEDTNGFVNNDSSPTRPETVDIGLNKKRVAYFVFPKEDNELRLVPGDELRLRYSGDPVHPAWQSVGHVIKLTAQEEVALELRASQDIASKITAYLQQGPRTVCIKHRLCYNSLLAARAFFSLSFCNHSV